MFEKTLIPVAYGERPEELRKIGTILKDLGSQSVCLFHVNESGSFFRSSDLSWFTILQEAKTGDGHIASSIAEAALMEGADEIYMKAKRRWHIGTILLGSVSQDLLRLSDVPVFVQKIRPRMPGKSTGFSRDDLTVLYATDFDEASDRLVSYVMEFQGARCHILHVRGRMADPSSERKRKKIVDKNLHAVEENLRPYFRHVSSEARIGDPAAEVLAVSDQINADVVVLGRKSPSFLSAPMGDTAERVVNESKASIFLVPQPGGRHAP